MLNSRLDARCTFVRTKHLKKVESCLFFLKRFFVRNSLFFRKKLINMKKKKINFRVTDEQYLEIKKRVTKDNITITELFLDMFYNRVHTEDKRKFLTKITKDDFILSKVGNNINQIARYVNHQKYITKDQSNELLILMRNLLELMNENSEIYRKILNFLAK